MKERKRLRNFPPSPARDGADDGGSADRCRLITDAQADAAMDGVADRLRPGGAIDEEIGDPSLGDAIAEPAAIFEPALVADRRRHHALTGHGGDDTGLRAERMD